MPSSLSSPAPPVSSGFHPEQASPTLSLQEMELFDSAWNFAINDGSVNTRGRNTQRHTQQAHRNQPSISLSPTEVEDISNEPSTVFQPLETSLFGYNNYVNQGQERRRRSSNPGESNRVSTSQGTSRLPAPSSSLPSRPISLESEVLEVLLAVVMQMRGLGFGEEEIEDEVELRCGSGS